MALPPDGNWNNTFYPSDILVRMWENFQNENYPLHWHTAVEIIMPLKQGYDVILREHTYHLKENDILIVPSLELHGINVPPDACNGKRFILMFEPSILYTIFGQSGIVSKLHTVTYITPETMPAIHQKIHSLLMDSYHELKKDDAFRFTAAYHHIIGMFIILLRYYTDLQKNTEQENSSQKNSPKEQVSTQQKYISRLDGVFEYIDKNFNEKIPLKRAAEIANFSEFHFARIFKIYTNISFHQYLQQVRINKSKFFLQNPKLSITDVALASGFTSLTTFNRVFKHIEKYTPSEYKKMYQFRI